MVSSYIKIKQSKIHKFICFVNTMLVLSQSSLFVVGKSLTDLHCAELKNYMTLCGHKISFIGRTSDI